jgi:hypothetical protein
VSTGESRTEIKSYKGERKKTVKDEEGHLFFNSEIFVLGDKDFGEQRLTLFDFKNLNGLHGTLGMDFLHRHLIYVDYLNKFLYIM